MRLIDEDEFIIKALAAAKAVDKINTCLVVLELNNFFMMAADLRCGENDGASRLNIYRRRRSIR
jgi:hypothetical protein